MFLPRSYEVPPILKSFFPLSGNDTLEINCKAGPCTLPGGADDVASQCVAIFNSIERGITRNLAYCVKDTPGSSTPQPSHFQSFIQAFADAFGVLIQLIAWILALVTVLFGLFVIGVIIAAVTEAIRSRWWPHSTKADETKTTSQPAGTQENPGNEMVDIPTTSTAEASGSRQGGEDVAESVSHESDDATQWDESETTQLMSADEKLMD